MTLQSVEDVHVAGQDLRSRHWEKPHAHLNCTIAQARFVILETFLIICYSTSSKAFQGLCASELTNRSRSHITPRSGSLGTWCQSLTTRSTLLALLAPPQAPVEQRSTRFAVSPLRASTSSSPSHADQTLTSEKRTTPAPASSSPQPLSPPPRHQHWHFPISRPCSAQGICPRDRAARCEPSASLPRRR